MAPTQVALFWGLQVLWLHPEVLVSCAWNSWGGREKTAKHPNTRDCVPPGGHSCHLGLRGSQLTSKSLSPTRTPARAAGPSSDTREMNMP